MILLHGTNRTALSGILEDGQLNGPVFLTDNIEVARHFAKSQRRHAEDDPVILAVEVCPQQLDVDEQSILDPIPLVRAHLEIKDTMLFLEEMASHEDSWLQHLALKKGLDQDRSRWELSLALCHAVQHTGPVQICDIRVL